MSAIGGYSSDVKAEFKEELMTISNSHIGSVMFHNPGRNHYSVIGNSLIVVKDIRLKRTGGVGSVNAWVLNFPKPLSNPTNSLAGMLLSLKGEAFFYSINSTGRVSIFGTFIDPNDELLFNIHPYIARYPIEYDATSPA